MAQFYVSQSAVNAMLADTQVQRLHSEVESPDAWIRLIVSLALRPQSTNTRAPPATIRVALPELPLASTQTRIGKNEIYDDDLNERAS